jgi:hypothetical protein
MVVCEISRESKNFFFNSKLYKYLHIYIYRSHDLYHTCYGLSGLSMAQHQFVHNYQSHRLIEANDFQLKDCLCVEGDDTNVVVSL